jgi:signal transduction histidine kinase
VKFAGDARPVEVEVWPDTDDALVLSVVDHGPGIPPAERQRVFERFHQAHGRGHYGGLGLGLHVSRELVELHGGTMTINEAAGGGARVVVRLPRAAASDASAARPGG